MQYHCNELLNDILKEGHIMIRKDELKLKISDYARKLIKTNKTNLYTNSPKFYQQLATDDLVHKYYIKFLILCVLIDYSVEDTDEIEFIEWQRMHRDSNIKAFLAGPSTNSTFKLDFIKYYNSIINPKIEDITGYHQTNIMQEQSKLLIQLASTNNNISEYTMRLPQITNGYQLFIDTSRISSKLVIDGNYIVDFSNVNIGEPDLKMPMTNAKKIEYIFNKYTCLTTRLRVWKGLYKYPLDMFKRIFIIFDGISTFDSTIYNVDIDYLKIGGRFKLIGDWFEFIPDFEHTVYRNTSNTVIRMNDVNRFRIYLLGDYKSIPLKHPRTVKITKIYNKVPTKHGYINISDKFVFDTFTNTLQSIIAPGNSSSYFWKFNGQYSPIKFTNVQLNKLTEEYLMSIVGNIVVEIDDFSVQPDYEYVDGKLFIDGNELDTPCYVNGYLFKDGIVYPPDEFEQNGTKYRHLRYSNDYFDTINTIPFTGISLGSAFNYNLDLADRIDTYGNGQLAVQIDGMHESVFMANSILFMRAMDRNIYYCYGHNEIDIGEYVKDGKEMELSMKFE